MCRRFEDFESTVQFDLFLALEGLRSFPESRCNGVFCTEDLVEQSLLTFVRLRKSRGRDRAGRFGKGTDEDYSRLVVDDGERRCRGGRGGGKSDRLGDGEGKRVSRARSG